MFEFNKTIKEDFNVYSYSKNRFDDKKISILVMDKASLEKNIQPNLYPTYG